MRLPVLEPLRKRSRIPYLHRLVALVVVTSCRLPAQAPTVRNAAERACSAPWNVQSLKASQSATALERPTAAHLGADYVMVGTRRNSLAEAPNGDSIAGFTVSGRSVPLPIAKGVRPLLIQDDSGATLLWGVLRPGALQWDGSGVAAVWMSRWRNDAWSPPEKIMQGIRLGWGRGGSHGAVAVGANAQEVAIPVIDSRGRQRIDVIRVTPDSVVIVAGPEVHGPTYARLAFDGDRRHIVFVGLDGTRDSDQNTLFFASSSRSGAWSAPIVLHRGGDNGASYPHIAATRDGTLHVVWGQLNGSAINHAASKDGGATWSPKPSLAGNSLFPLDVLPIGGQTVGVLYDDYDYRGLEHATVACAVKDGWTPPQRLGGVARIGAGTFVDRERFILFAQRVVDSTTGRLENVMVSPPR